MDVRYQADRGGRIVGVALALLIGTFRASGADSACIDVQALRDARFAAFLGCTQSTTTHLDYARCTKASALAQVQSGALPLDCVREVQLCAQRSPFGTTKTACGRVAATGKGSCRLTSNTSRCLATDPSASCCEFNPGSGIFASMAAPDYTVSTHPNSGGLCPAFVQNVGLARAPISTVTQLFCGGASCEFDRNTACFDTSECSSQGKGRCTGICIASAGCSQDSDCPAGTICSGGFCTGSPPTSCFDDAGCSGPAPVCKGAARFVTPPLRPGDTSPDLPTPGYPKCYTFPDQFYTYESDFNNILMENENNNVGGCTIIG